MRARLLALAAASVLALAGFAGAADARPGHAAGTDVGATNSTASGPGTRTGATTPSRHVATRVTEAAADTSGCTDTTGKPYATGLPPLPCLPNPFSHETQFFDYGAPLRPTTQKVRKPKITLQLPPLIVRAFDIVCSSSFPPAFPPCPFDPHYPKADPSVTPGYFGTFASAWVTSPKGVQPQFGVFPPLHVAMLAFGAIPVSATVHITQPVKNGISQPMTLNWLQSETIVTPGKEIPGYPQYGKAPRGNATTGGYFWGPPAQLSGPIDISISDVRVDQVKLPVGSSCGTSTTLNLGSPGGFYAANLPPQRGEPGGYAPLLNGKSYLDGEVDIPAFHGCHHGAEDLDPLLTGMVSGPDNPVATTQTAALAPYGCVIDPTDPNCATSHPAALGSAARAVLTPAQRSALGAATPRAAELRSLPVRVRKLLIARGLVPNA